MTATARLTTPIAPLLTTRELELESPTGRPLIRGLNLSVSAGERVAMVGRNGAGKSSLLQVLAGLDDPRRGRVSCSGSRVLVPQLLDPTLNRAPAGQPSSGFANSPGEQRRQALAAAFETAPDFLLLDEPSVDLDDVTVKWLTGALHDYAGACLLVSHDRRLLRLFDDYFVVAESGCFHHSGSFDSLLEQLKERQAHEQRRYARQLAEHAEREEHHVRIARRRERKKNGGRVRELKRCPARAQLNGKRGYAQVYQAKRQHLQEARITAARNWVTSVRRALAVTLPLRLESPDELVTSREPIIDARLVRASRDLASKLPCDVRIGHERWAIVGPNGSGKSTLLRALLGEDGELLQHRVEHARLGYIGQNAANWLTPTSLLDQLCPTADALPSAAATIAAHGFPLALAKRPLDTLSPGERVRAALIALSARTPAVELLVLDEPTNHLDLLAASQLEQLLRAWPGGLLVVSHDREFLKEIGVQHWLSRERDGWTRLNVAPLV